jgi:hypothetical protein
MNMQNPIVDVSVATSFSRAVRSGVWARALFLLAVGAPFMFSQMTPHRAAGTDAPSVVQTEVKLVIGGETVKNNSVGTLSVVGNSLLFTKGNKKKTMAVDASSILDISTNEDSRQDITGAAHFATMAIPYGGGRVLALFSHHVDVLTVEFKDSNGGCHGTVFVLAQGQAAPFKKQLLALGAKATVPLVEPAPADKQEDKH